MMMNVETDSCLAVSHDTVLKVADMQWTISVTKHKTGTVNFNCKCKSAMHRKGKSASLTGCFIAAENSRSENMVS